ncbi:MAG: efflux RND transporter permease subunit [Thiotrichales bacterium]
MSAQSLNSAGKLAKTFLESKITALIMLGVTLWGLMAYFVTPRLYNPEIVVPAAQILVVRPGQSPEEIQAQVVKPLEALMSSLSGVEHTFGYSVNDLGVVTVQFEVGRDETDSLVKLYNEMNRNMDRLPPGTMQPIVKSIGISDVPILTITLSSEFHDGVVLREVANRFLEQLRALPDVGVNSIIGGQKMAARVLIDPAKLSSTGITLEQVQQMLQGSNAVFPAGSLVNNNQLTSLRVDGAFANVEELGNIIIGAPNNHPVYLKDVAKVEYGPFDQDQYSTFAYGQADPGGNRAGDAVPAAVIAIGKRSGKNSVTIAEEVLAKLAELEEQALPQGINVEVTRDYGKRADHAVNTLMEHLAIAVIVVAVILLFFLGWREAAIVTLTVPLTLFVVLGVGMAIGQSINRITLFALILSLGLLVDAAIVVIENIHRHLHAGEHTDFKKLLVAATNEIGNPTNIATIAVILAFVPMAFVGGMMGPFMRPIPINVPVTMIASLVLAYIVVPWAARQWLHGKALKAFAEHETLEHADHEPDWLQRTYRKVAEPLIDNRVGRNLLFGFVLLLLIASMIMPAWQFIRPGGMNGPVSMLGVSLKMLPEGNVNTFVLEVDTPEGSAVEYTGRVVEAVDSVLAESPYVTNYQNFLGRTAALSFSGMVRGDAVRQGANLAQIQVNLVDKHHRPKTAEVATEIYEALQPIREQFADSRIKLYLTPPGPPVRSQVLAEIYGPDYEKLRETAALVKDEFRKVYGMINIDDSVTANVPEYLIRIDQHKAMLAGVAPGQIAKLIHDYVYGVKAGAVHMDYPEPVDIVIQLDRTQRAWIRQIKDLKITNQMGKQIPLGSLVAIDKTSQAKPIYSQDQHQVVYVMGDLLNASPVYATITLNSALNQVELPNGVTLSTANLGFVAATPDDVTNNELLWGGDMRLTLDVFRDLGAAFIVALVFIYLLLVAYYQSFMLPLIVMGAIPLTLVGIFPGHWLFNMPFNATSMIGFIALAGIVVRNSLLLIDFVLDYRNEGYSLKESVLQAGAIRFRPILLTALAIMFGSAVMVSDPVFGGLAVSLIFGTFASTALTLLVIPLMYYIWQYYTVEKKAAVNG